MKLSVKDTNLKFTGRDTVALFISEDDLKKPSLSLPYDLGDSLESIDTSFFKAKKGESLFYPTKKGPNIILCGIGSNEKMDLETLRNASSSVTLLCMEKSIREINIIIPEINKIHSDDTLASIAEGISLSSYIFDRYKTKNGEDPKKPLEKGYFFSGSKKAAEILARIEILSGNTKLCRDLANEMSYAASPSGIASVAKKLSKIKGISCKVYGKKEIEKLKMGLLLAVNQGSKEAAQLVVLKYTGNPSSKKYTALVGKGITFDSGGMNLKPTGSIETMREDMSGAAAVIYSIKAAAELKLKKNLYAVIPLTENMLSNDAYRPGDIFRSYSGKTVEIGNTDAEGRLVLADAIAFTEDTLKPEYIIDIATLTGACVVTFGETVAALMTTDDSLASIIEGSSAKTGEKLWRLPFYEDYEDRLKSDFADICNMSSEKNAGTIIGGVFLKNFIKKTKWAHIDIASTSWYSKQRGYRPKNATGYGVRLLVDIIEHLN